MFLFLSWTCFSLPATFSLVGASVAANRYSMGIGVQMVIKRLPIMVAPLVGGILIDRFGVIPGVRVALIISILLAGATFIALRELREEVKESEETVPIPERWNFLRCLREFDAPMRWPQPYALFPAPTLRINNSANLLLSPPSSCLRFSRLYCFSHGAFMR